MPTQLVVGDSRGIDLELFLVQRVFRQIDAVIMVHVVLVIHAPIHLEAIKLACCDVDVEGIVHVA